MPPVWSCSRCNKVTPKANRRGDLCSRCAPDLEPFDLHAGGQLRIGAAGDQLELLALSDERIPASSGPALVSPALLDLVMTTTTEEGDPN